LNFGREESEQPSSDDVDEELEQDDVEGHLCQQTLAFLFFFLRDGTDEFDLTFEGGLVYLRRLALSHGSLQM
jgi:hypothetical protein